MIARKPRTLAAVLAAVALLAGLAVGCTFTGGRSDAWEPLSEEELAYFRRGRNAHPHGIPKHATPGEYARATGLEALFGALYLSGQTARIEALFAAMMEEDHAI